MPTSLRARTRARAHMGKLKKMRSYIKAFMAPDGITVAPHDLWGNNHEIAIIRHQVGELALGTSIFTTINALNVGLTGKVVLWQGLDASLNVVESVPGPVMGFGTAYFGFVPYAHHPLN